MAVAAYASLVSLMDVLDNVQHLGRRRRLHLDKEQIQNLQEKVKLLQDFLEVHSQRISPEMENLVRQLLVLVDDADDIIDFHVANQLREESQDKSLHTIALTSFCQYIDKIIEKIDSITEKLMMVKEEWIDVQEQQPEVSMPVGSTSLPYSDENTMLGFDERLLQVVDELTRDESNLQILPIVGMGGIGKTTLAQNAHDHPYIVNRFDIRIWFTISQQYSVQKILQKYFFNDNKDIIGSTDQLGVAELGERLHKLLFGKRYLIIMDDVWSIKTWEDFMLYLPNNGNKSRVLVTTRLLEVARPLCFDNHYFTVDFLDEDKSWDLLCGKVFAQKSCPYPELEEIGREIAKGCRGLPLSIVVIGGLLAKSNKTREYWGFVAKNVTSFVNYGDDEYCLKILSLSYNSLSIHLKPCFLYTRVFPEDQEIRAPELKKLWISEGFLKPVGGKSLEEAAEEYLKDLTDRNLIFIRKRTRRGNIRTCGVHDILRELCFREYSKEHLIRVPKSQRIAFQVQPKFDFCFLCGRLPDRLNRIHLKQLVGLRSTTVASSLVCEACNNMYPDLNRLRWVKVFDLDNDQSFETFPQHTKLRYLAVQDQHATMVDYLLEWKIVFPNTISLLWNLQILDLDLFYMDTHTLVLSSEIWEIPKLRHLNVQSFRLPDPLVNDLEGQDFTILEYLSTLSSEGFRCIKEVVKRIPNLKKLNASYRSYSGDASDCSLSNLVQLNKLESLSLEYYSLLENITFPTSLKKLSLSYCEIPWRKMTIISSLLPNLEVLKLNNAFRGQEWDPSEGEFLRLKVLHISFCDLMLWGAEDIHFPNLQYLSLEGMFKLEEIPLSIGDIATLHSIHLQFCGESAVNSATEILTEQKENGNESLQVYVDGKQVHVSL
ncbi:putative late blight resistance protein homolog R1A-3 [Sesamum indicum]|uniref:Late blight resistance protein homolog R1A-3 n=1 Tax=Sesamum indicum TaxID=4182 RepID=A0A6I9SPQ7_SESIN|nr:putative late blight resistance protein homolog R1A-3 [Sesamum indicum]